jgi:type III secretion protein O
MAMIDELLFIKTFREHKAETELQKSRARLGIAAQSERDAQQALEDFVAQATADELRWYQELCSRVVKPRDIADVQNDVAGLRQKELEHNGQWQAAQQHHVKAKDEFQGATTRMRDASTARQKFFELARNHHSAVAREVERKEELELEELANVVREREEWSTHD